jgi:hypothetical protein
MLSPRIRLYHLTILGMGLKNGELKRTRVEYRPSAAASRNSTAGSG